MLAYCNYNLGPQYIENWLLVPSIILIHTKSRYNSDLGITKFTVFPFLQPNAITPSLKRLDFLIHGNRRGLVVYSVFFLMIKTNTSL